jgi:hypothetical protein
MIKAKEIMRLVESPQKTFIDFMNEIYKHTDKLKFETIESGSTCSLSFEVTMVKAVSYPGMDDLFFVAIEPKLKQLVSDFEYYFGNGKIKSTHRPHGYQVSFAEFQASLSIYRSMVPLTGNNGNEFMISFQFRKEFIDHMFNPSNQKTNFPGVLVSEFEVILDYIIKYRSEKVNLVFARNRTNVFADMVKAYSHLSLDVEYSDEVLTFVLEIPIGINKSPNYFFDFVAFAGDKITIPLLGISKIAGPIILGVKPQSYKINILKTQLRLVVILSSPGDASVPEVRNSRTPELVVVFRIIFPNELVFLPEDTFKPLALSIGNMFMGYKKLVNQFINKPDKKTNADW